MLCAVVILIFCSFKYLFGICLFSMLISLSNLSIFLQNDQFHYFQPILVAIFMTIAIKVKIIWDFYTLVIILID